MLRDKEYVLKTDDSLPDDSRTGRRLAQVRLERSGKVSKLSPSSGRVRYQVRVQEQFPRAAVLQYRQTLSDGRVPAFPYKENGR